VAGSLKPGQSGTILPGLDSLAMCLVPSDSSLERSALRCTLR